MHKILIIILLQFIYFLPINAEVIKKIDISGNSRVNEETIKIYGGIEINKDYSEKGLNKILNNLYSTNFFKDVKISLANNVLSINLIEHPVINQLVIIGEPSKKYKDEIIDLLKVKMGVESIDDMNILEFSKYAKKRLNKERENGNKNGNIAVVYATGSIGSGEGDLETIGSEGVSKALRAARLNDSVKAVVFRVNSPGGSALASDVIWREVKLLEETDKPIIVSMGDYAASGGYYISCAADKIYAQANTVTGSIGVFGVIPNLEGFLSNEMGITTERVETNEYSALTISKPLSEKELLLMQKSVDEIYEVFKGRVADGREGLDVAGVDSIGQGRVWSGTSALEIGLVDEIGGIQDAIDYAAELAEIAMEERTIIEYPIVEVNKFEALIEELAEKMDEGNSGNEPGLSIQLMKQLKAIDEMTKMKGVQARLPFQLTFK